MVKLEPKRCIVGKAFALIAANPGLVLSLPYGPEAPSRIISEYRSRDNPRELSGVDQRQINEQTKIIVVKQKLTLKSKYCTIFKY